MRQLSSRQQLDQPRRGTSTQTIVIVLVVVISILVFCIIFFFWYFNRRAKLLRQHHGFSKRQSWRASIQSYATAFITPPHGASIQPDMRESTHSTAGTHRMGHVETAAGIDRNTSIRSVMTLPRYSAVPGDNEGVIGREGERAGMDTVVEFPETNETEEERRDEEMESLYQIRLARRRETEARQDRRRRRREARDRGDVEALAALQEESRRAAQERELNGSEALILEHESRPRSRRVSAVNYGDLGVARLDGSRVRGNSGESDRPLLDASGAFGVSAPLRPWMSRESLASHRRGSSSMLSVTSYGSDDGGSAWSDMDSGVDDDDGDNALLTTTTLHSTRPRSRSRSRSQARTLSRPRSAYTLGAATGPTTPRPRGRNLSLNTGVEFPPPPPYKSPVGDDVAHRLRSAAAAAAPSLTDPPPSLPTIERLPSIHIIANTPVDRDPPLRRPSFPNFSLRRESLCPPVGTGGDGGSGGGTAE